MKPDITQAVLQLIRATGRPSEEIHSMELCGGTDELKVTYYKRNESGNFYVKYDEVVTGVEVIPVVWDRLAVEDMR